nr:hypothetical protein [uncultured Methanobrevibacter sp.]
MFFNTTFDAETENILTRPDPSIVWPLPLIVKVRLIIIPEVD